MTDMTVYVVFRIHGGPEAVDFATVCGVFRNLGDAKACLGNEYRAARPADEWIFSEDPPGNNNYMRAEIVQTDDEFDRFGIMERKVQ